MRAGQRYSAVAIVLHWAIAIALISNIGLGWWMHGAIESQDSQSRAIAAYQVHKSIGLTVLALSLLRLAWRLRHPPPALPATMPVWEKRAAVAVHWLFYGLMIAIPLSGWLYVSTQWRDGAPLQVPTLWFGVFEVPHLFGLDQASRPWRRTGAGIAFNFHWALAWGTAVLLALHIAAACKHQFIDRDEVAARMIPLLESGQGRRARALVLRTGMAGIALAGVAIVYTQFQWAEPGESSRGKTAAITATEAGWAVLPGESAIVFSGEHAGRAFQGRFERWQADVRIEPANVTKSRITAAIATASAADGVPLHNETLPEQEWFDAANHPKAEYRAEQIRPRGGNRYAITGKLRIKDHDIAVPPLTLTLDGKRATIAGSFQIDRKAANLGMESDPAGRWVSREITVQVRAVFQQRS